MTRDSAKFRNVSTWLMAACGIWLVGLGGYFIALRPALLPEDARFIGTSVSQIRVAMPGLEPWLAHVFTVMGGFMAGAGVLTLFVATVAMPRRLKGTSWAIAVSGFLTVALMSVTNVALDSDFKWLLLVPAFAWLTALACYVAEAPQVLPLHDESEAEVPASADSVFALVDDHARLSAHMSQPSWRMGGARMDTIVDDGQGQRVGSHIRMTARVLGLRLSLDEVITEREPPTRKAWETVGTPRLLVIGSYRMGFEITPRGNRCLLRVFIDYAWPDRWPNRWLGRMFAGYYARWCTKTMVNDAVRQLTK